MRLTIASTGRGLTGNVSSSVDAEEADIRRQLEPFLPFASYALDPQARIRRAPEAALATPVLFKLPLRLGNHLWCADETRLLPQLGCGGAAMIAWTLARHLDPTITAQGH
jgi:hypothetical protein